MLEDFVLGLGTSVASVLTAETIFEIMKCMYVMHYRMLTTVSSYQPNDLIKIKFTFIAVRHCYYFPIKLYRIVYFLKFLHKTLPCPIRNIKLHLWLTDVRLGSEMTNVFLRLN